MNDWYPNQDAKLYSFLTNFVATIDEACVELGVAPTTYDIAKASANAWLASYTARQAAQKSLDAALSAFQKQAPDTEKSLRAAARQIKGIMDVPDSVLSLLELSSSGEGTLARAAAQSPQLAATVELGTVVLKYKKLGHQAVFLYGCRTGEETFSLLGTYTLNRIEDPRPVRVAGQPEQRQYYAIYMDKDQPNGGQSPTVSVVVGDKPVAALLR
ncbi:MAG: hypothetical protein EOO36_13745 [Cytophagaceae bacterium]|nr:MAG: hypothetical protein EOO36_13745 [Cytophagaceae bacterium]